MNILGHKTSQLLELITIIPDKFEDVLIWKADEIDNFDIGFKDFFLIAKKDIDTNKLGFEDLEEIAGRMYHKYSVSIDQPESRDDLDILFFKRTLISKPINLLGEVELDSKLYYNERIRDVLTKGPAGPGKDE